MSIAGKVAIWGGKGWEEKHIRMFIVWQSLVRVAVKHSFWFLFVRMSANLPELRLSSCTVLKLIDVCKLSSSSASFRIFFPTYQETLETMRRTTIFAAVLLASVGLALTGPTPESKPESDHPKRMCMYCGKPKLVFISLQTPTRTTAHAAEETKLMRTHTHTRTRSWRNKCVRARACTHTHTRARARTHTHTHNTHRHVRAHKHACTYRVISCAWTYYGNIVNARNLRKKHGTSWRRRR